MRVRCRHERGDIGTSRSFPALLELAVEGGTSIASGLRVFVVEAVEAAILCKWFESVKKEATAQQSSEGVR